MTPIDFGLLVSKDIVKFDSTIHKQIIDLIEKSGTKGMTLNVMSVFIRKVPQLNACKT
jgi:hypothetical protein